MDINKILNQVIPPADYEHRNGFSNTAIVDSLNEDDKRQLEDALIYRLLFETNKNVDTLIVETLAHLKSQKAVPILSKLLEKPANETEQLIIAASIFEINQDAAMIQTAISALRKLDNPQDPYYESKLTYSFFFLAKLRNPEINKVLEEYTTRKEYLISYNAKRYLDLYK